MPTGPTKAPERLNLMGPVFDLDLLLPPRGSRQRTRELHRQLRDAIVAGRLRAGVRLPGSRALADGLKTSRNAVVAVYDLLLGEGYVTTRPGGGTYVAAVTPPSRSGRAAAARADAAALPDLRLAPRFRQPAPLVRFDPGTAFEADFGVGVPETREFPFAVWRRLAARTLRELSRHPSSYADPAGSEALRQAIAGHVSFVRAVACTVQDIVVTSGAQQAFDLLARALVTPGKTVVVVEQPGYTPMRLAFEAAGARIAGVPVDGEGLVVERLPRGARVVCVTPSHQFPLGPAMSMRRRIELLDFARRSNAVVVEDDYDGEFRHGGRPLDALQTLDRHECVMYVGTFSKSVFPELRLGYVASPAWCRPALLRARQCSDWHGNLLAEDTLAAFIAEGHLARHVRRMRGVYTQRRDALLQALQRWCAGSLQALPSMGGLHVAARRKGRWAPVALCELAARERLRVSALEWFAVPGMAANRWAASGLVFGLGAIERERIDSAVRGLARLLDSTTL